MSDCHRPAETTDELDEDFAALHLRVGVVAELRDAVAAVIAARVRHAEEDEARQVAIRGALRAGARPLSASTEVLAAEREIEVDGLWDQVAAVAERLIGCAAVSSGWLAEFSRLEGERQQALGKAAEDERRRETRRREVDGSSFVELAPESLRVVGKGESLKVVGKAEPIAEEVRVEASRDRLRLVGEPFVEVDDHLNALAEVLAADVAASQGVPFGTRYGRVLRDVFFEGLSGAIVALDVPSASEVAADDREADLEEGMLA